MKCSPCQGQIHATPSHGYYISHTALKYINSLSLQQHLELAGVVQPDHNMVILFAARTGIVIAVHAIMRLQLGMIMLVQAPPADEAAEAFFDAT